MQQLQATVTEKTTIAPAWWQLSLSAPLGRDLLPGQFLLVQCPGSCYLRRPIFPRAAGDDTLTFLLRPSPDPGLTWLMARQPGDSLDVIGPLGQGYPLPENIRHLLLISETQALSPILGQMDRALAAGIATSLLLIGSRAAGILPTRYLPPEVELVIITPDSRKEPVQNQVVEAISWADMVCAVGTLRLYHSLKAHTEQLRFGSTTGFLFGLAPTDRLLCGVGACWACAVPTRREPRLICTDGPVFDLMAVDLQELNSD